MLVFGRNIKKREKIKYTLLTNYKYISNYKKISTNLKIYFIGRKFNITCGEKLLGICHKQKSCFFLSLTYTMCSVSSMFKRKYQYHLKVINIFIN